MYQSRNTCQFFDELSVKTFGRFVPPRYTNILFKKTLTRQNDKQNISNYPDAPENYKLAPGMWPFLLFSCVVSKRIWLRRPILGGFPKARK